MTAAPRALVGGRLVLPDGVLDHHALVLDGERIAAIVPTEAIGAGPQRIDVAGALVLPGLVDIHTHGAGGRLFNEADVDAWSTIVELQAAHGVTSLLATTMTAPIEELVAALEFARTWTAQEHHGARVLGVHVEGPYFARSQAGAQNPEHVRNPDDGTAAELLAYSDVVRMMSFAPELPGAIALTRDLVARGIVAAAGHSEARDADVLAAMDAGLRHVIHVWSAQSTTVREGPWRRPGLLEASLAFDGLSVEMIADGCHLPVTLMRLAYKAIGPERLCVVSDATHGAGLPEGSELRLGGLDIVVDGGVAMLRDRTAFAGSTSLLDRMLRVLTRDVGLPLHEAVRMASLNPARVIGADGHTGSLEVGKDADLALFDHDLVVRRTMIGGRWYDEVPERTP
ncbi:N-acetylglucosamine-6-phosphate deacetylase [soil metagenome]